jgi:hypothetical protein
MRIDIAIQTTQSYFKKKSQANLCNCQGHLPAGKAVKYINENYTIKQDAGYIHRLIGY